MFVLDKLPMLALGALLGTFGLVTNSPVSTGHEFEQPKPVQPFVSCSTCSENGSTHQFLQDCCVPGFDTCRQCSQSYPVTCHTTAAQGLCTEHNKCVVE